MEEHARIARGCHVPHAVVPVNGSAIRLAPGSPRIVSYEKVGRLVLDGEVILPADGSTMQARRRLMMNGYIAASLVLNAKGRLAADPVLFVQGLPVEEDRAAFEKDCAKAIRESIGGSQSDARTEELTRQALRRVVRDWTGKKPVTDVSLVRI